MNQTAAQTTQSVGKATSPQSMVQSSPMLNFVVPLLSIVVLFYFLIAQPQNKEKQKRESLLSSLQRGDRVLTRGGLYGIVTDIKENVLTIKINENNKIEVERSYIETVQKPS